MSLQRSQAPGAKASVQEAGALGVKVACTQILHALRTQLAEHHFCKLSCVTALAISLVLLHWPRDQRSNPSTGVHRVLFISLERQSKRRQRMDSEYESEWNEYE